MCSLCDRFMIVTCHCCLRDVSQLTPMGENSFLFNSHRSPLYCVSHCCSVDYGNNEEWWYLSIEEKHQRRHTIHILLRWKGLTHSLPANKNKQEILDPAAFLSLSLCVTISFLLKQEIKFSKTTYRYHNIFQIIMAGRVCLRDRTFLILGLVISSQRRKK